MIGHWDLFVNYIQGKVNLMFQAQILIVYINTLTCKYMHTQRKSRAQVNNPSSNGASAWLCSKA